MDRTNKKIIKITLKEIKDLVYEVFLNQGCNKENSNIISNNHYYYNINIFIKTKK